MTVDAKVAELVDIGATVDHPFRIDTDTLQRYSMVMHDPQGNEFWGGVMLGVTAHIGRDSDGVCIVM